VLLILSVASDAQVYTIITSHVLNPLPPTSPFTLQVPAVEDFDVTKITTLYATSVEVLSELHSKLTLDTDFFLYSSFHMLFFKKEQQV
jgi:hypothetical protein